MLARVRFVFPGLAVLPLVLVIAACTAGPTTPPPPPPQPTALALATAVRATRASAQNTSTPVPVSATQSALQPTTKAPAAPPLAPTNPPASSPTPPAAQPPAGLSVPESYFGVNTNGEIIYSDEVRALSILAGVQMVRLSAEWKTIEKTPGTYTWGSTDSALNPLLANNMAPLVLIMENPAWAANSPCGPVQDLLAFERFIGALVAKYPQVKFWALYNEPDNSAYPKVSPGGCFGGDDIDGNGKRDVEDYAEHLRLAWRALHRANPDARLVTGALAFDSFDPASVPAGYPGGGQGGNFDYSFPGRLFQYIQSHPLQDGEKYFDILSFNFYYIYGPYWEKTVGGVGISAKVNMLEKLMRDNGVSFPMLVSETGEDSKRVGDDAQSEYLVKTYVRGLASHLQAMIWWTFQDYPDSNPPPSNTWKYGLIDQDKTPKLSYGAFQTASRELTGARFLQPLEVQGGEGYLFTQDEGGKAVVWSSTDSPVSISFTASKLLVVNMYGAKKEVPDGDPQDNDAAAGRIGIGVDRNPVYIQVVAR